MAGLALLRNPNVGRLFFAYLVTYTGTAMAPIALAFGVLDLTGSAADAAIVIAAPTFAATVVLLFGGVLADRTSRKHILVGAEIISMLAQATMAALFISGTATVPLLTACMLVNGIAMALHAPAATGLIIQLVPREALQSTNALLGTARNAAMAGGAAMGGVLVALVGAGPTLAADALSFGISAIAVATLTPRAQLKAVPTSVVRELRDGWREFVSHTWLWVIVAQFSLVVAATESIFGLIGPAVARDQMGGAMHWGFIAAGFGAGTLLGGLAAMKVRPRYPMRVATILVLFFTGISLALLLQAPLYIVVLAAIVSGVTGQIFGVLWYTTLQMKIPEEMLSRVAAYDHLGSIVLAPLGIVAAGMLYETFGAQTTLAISIATVAIPTCIALCVHDVRWMTAADPASKDNVARAAENQQV